MSPKYFEIDGVKLAIDAKNPALIVAMTQGHFFCQIRKWPADQFFSRNRLALHILKSLYIVWILWSYKLLIFKYSTS